MVKYLRTAEGGLARPPDEVGSSDVCFCPPSPPLPSLVGPQLSCSLFLSSSPSVWRRASRPFSAPPARGIFSHEAVGYLNEIVSTKAWRVGKHADAWSVSGGPAPRDRAAPAAGSVSHCLSPFLTSDIAPTKTSKRTPHMSRALHGCHCSPCHSHTHRTYLLRRPWCISCETGRS